MTLPQWSGDVVAAGKPLSLEAIRRAKEAIFQQGDRQQFAGPIVSDYRYRLCISGNHVPFFGICAFCWTPATRYGTAYTEWYKVRGRLAGPRGALP